MCKLSSSPEFLIKQCFKRRKREQIVVSGHDLKVFGLFQLVSQVDLASTRVELVYIDTVMHLRSQNKFLCFHMEQ